MPKVSVIIPVYGVEKYIERCARSLFGQTLDDIEYLFIDDCSPDKSVEILEHILLEYPQRRDKVIIHRMEHNSGQAKVREWGMRMRRVIMSFIVIPTIGWMFVCMRICITRRRRNMLI